MKTYQEILNDTIENDFRYEIITSVSPEARAAKEYAKQWLDEAAEVAMLQAEKGLPVGDAVYELKNLIDKH